MGNTPLSPLERIRAQQADLNIAIVCPRCGSDWFQEVTYKRFSSRRFGSSPGEDHEEVSTMPQTLRVCLCGLPFSPNISGDPRSRGRTPNAEITSFLRSLEAARDYILNQSAVGKVNELAAAVPSLKEVQDLTAQVQTLTTTVAKLNQGGGRQPHAPKNQAAEPSEANATESGSK